MSDDRLRTEDGTPIGGWVLRADPGGFDVAGTLAEYGQVFRFPLEPSDRSELMDAGQPCFLWSGDRSRVVGLWAIGEVVGPTTLVELDAGPDGEDGSRLFLSELYAEVELLPLVKPLSADKLRADKVLAGSELFTEPDRPNPVVLRPEEVRAIEGFDFDFAEPTEEQLARVDEVLGHDDGMVLQLVGLDTSFGILDDRADDGLLAVVTVTTSGAFELGRFEALVDAFDLVRLHARALELPEPVELVDGAPDGDPVAMLLADDGSLLLYRVGPATFDLYESTDEGTVEPVERYDGLDEALAAMAEGVEELDEDEGEDQA
ncbi:MAG TPA: hypothetical protein VHK88_06110 [Aquihabitans sp.]|nr:hypothetical protein [Aquihabitans sp.]